MDWHSIAASAVALALAFGILFVIWMVLRPLALLLMSVVLAETLEPAVGFLQRWMRRVFAVVTAYVGLLLALILLALLMVPTFLSEIGGLTEQLPQIREDVRAWFEAQGWISLDQVQSALGGQAGGGGGGLATIPLMIFSGALEVFLAVFLSIYWLIAKPGARSLMLSMVPPESRSRADELAQEVGSTVGGYLRGVVITGGILAIITFIALTIIGVDYALPLAVFVFFGELIPILGPLIAAIPALAVAALGGGFTQLLMVAGLYIVLQVLENNVVYPQVMKRETSIPPFLVIFAILAGGSVGGLIGALVAIPLAGAIRILILQLAVPEIQRRMGDGRPVRQKQLE